MGQFYSDPDLVGYIRSLEQRINALERTSQARGRKLAIPEESSTSSAAYGLLDPADLIENVSLPTDGVIFVMYEAAFKSSSLDAGAAAIFLGDTQLTVGLVQQSAPQAQEAPTSGAAIYQYLTTTPCGLAASQGTVIQGNVSSGQAVALAPDSGGIGGNLRHRLGGVLHTYAAPAGGPCAIFATAGNYDISIRFKTSAGTLSVKERKLWVWTQGLDG